MVRVPPSHQPIDTDGFPTMLWRCMSRHTGWLHIPTTSCCNTHVSTPPPASILDAPQWQAAQPKVPVRGLRWPLTRPHTTRPLPPVCSKGNLLATMQTLLRMGVLAAGSSLFPPHWSREATLQASLLLSEVAHVLPGAASGGLRRLWHWLARRRPSTTPLRIYPVTETGTPNPLFRLLRGMLLRQLTGTAVAAADATGAGTATHGAAAKPPPLHLAPDGTALELAADLLRLQVSRARHSTLRVAHGARACRRRLLRYCTFPARPCT